MEKTEKIYLNDSFILENTATVLSCRQRTSQSSDMPFEVLLDRSVFFPEGGGQPCDKGNISGSKVDCVFEENELVWHCCDREFAVGEAVDCHINIEHRLRMMQQHTGEHLLSAAAFALYKANNVGFHLTEDNLYVDFDCALSPEQLIEIENLTNCYVFEGLPVKISYLTPEEYAAIPMRKKAKDLQGDIRMISVEDLDYATCCGTHCANTAQVGFVKILRCDRYKGGSRVEMCCGKVAVAIFDRYNQVITELGKKFSVKPDMLMEAVDKSAAETASLRNEIKSKNRQLATFYAKELLQNAKPTPHGSLICADVTAHAPLARDISEELSRHDIMAVVYTLIDGKLTYFTSARGCGITARDICNTISNSIGGKGGGSDTMAQGRGEADTNIDLMAIITHQKA